ncbi:hypothetical protein OKA06_03385 [Novosphingobium sp. MW5]|nr:hypothetical protein [Novosphingobium sp. MW5]
MPALPIPLDRVAEFLGDRMRLAVLGADHDRSGKDHRTIVLHDQQFERVAGAADVRCSGMQVQRARIECLPDIFDGHARHHRTHPGNCRMITACPVKTHAPFLDEVRQRHVIDVAVHVHVAEANVDFGIERIACRIEQ